MKPLDLIVTIHEIAGENGVGRVDIMEDRIIGLKVRENYECPAARVIIPAHQALEALVCTKEEREFKVFVDQKWGELAYAGLWYDPFKDDLEAFINQIQTRVTGTVNLRLFKGSCVVTGRASKYALYNEDLASFDSKTFDQSEAVGIVETTACKRGCTEALKAIRCTGRAGTTPALPAIRKLLLMKYRNPIIPGFHPDPSVCRVGEDYYLVNSSFEYFPGVPIYHSRDLINWRCIGHCLTRPSQLPLKGCWNMGGIWAPTIRFHNSRFYMTTTNQVARGNFFVYADDPAGEWSEPIWIEQDGIDPSFLFDDDGKIYYTSTCPGGIQQCEIDIRTGKEAHRVPADIEGNRGLDRGSASLQHRRKILPDDGRGRNLLRAHGDHMALKQPLGSVRAMPRNPILSHRNKDQFDIHGTGHADMLQAHDGSWWMVFLAFRSTYGFLQHLGRETYLAPVTWTDDGWPVVYNNGWVELEMEADTLPPHPWPAKGTRDDFDNETLGLDWNHIRNPYPENYSLKEKPGSLRLHGSAINLDELDSPAFIGRRQQHFDCRAAALLDFDPKEDGEEAGLTVLANAEHHYEIAVTRLAGQRKVIVRRRIGDLSAIVAQENIADGPITLQIDAQKAQYAFGYALGDQGVRQIAIGSTRYLTVEVAVTFTGTYFGLYATGNGKANTAAADFAWFDYEAT